MGLSLFGRRRRRDPDAFFRDLAAAQLGAGYGAAERRRDFRSVFATPAGRRVLWTLFDWCGLYRPVAVKGDPYETYHRDGRRDIGLRILKALDTEPLERPDSAQSESEKEGTT